MMSAIHVESRIILNGSRCTVDMLSLNAKTKAPPKSSGRAFSMDTDTITIVIVSLNLIVLS